MAELFSDEWMKKFKDAWNAEPGIKAKLAEIGFDSVICYGFKGEDNPRGFLKVEKGECTSAGSWRDESPNWDLRADQEHGLVRYSTDLLVHGIATEMASGGDLHDSRAHPCSAMGKLSFAVSGLTGSRHPSRDDGWWEWVLCEGVDNMLNINSP